MISTTLPPPGPRFSMLANLLRRIVLVVVIGIALRILAGCAAMPLDGPTAASVVLVRDGVRACGGVATGPRTLMTAAHCVDDLPLGAFAPAEQAIVTSDDWREHGTARVSARARVLSRDDGLDLAVLGLDATADPLPAWVDMAKAPLFLKFTTIRARDGVWRWDAERGAAGLAAFEICAGDSGSGVFNDDAELIGVIATRFAGDTETSKCGPGGTWRPLGVEWAP